ncbi:hypothetical protein [Pseudooceanicola sp.]|uniref:hypothetical protein n=1 Tax=Pseudooceanicola sp. TaxID=1914328 RepID=UPI002611F0C8|nr:hypothetical protein [Pseudooceanicola sp.]MDF1856584.1 hypothetical protein [Pseudooceanicola sp.]
MGTEALASRIAARAAGLHWFWTFYTNPKTVWAEETRARKPVHEISPPDAPLTCEHENFPSNFTPPFQQPNPGQG